MALLPRGRRLSPFTSTGSSFVTARACPRVPVGDTECGPWAGAGSRQPHAGRKDPGPRPQGRVVWATARDQSVSDSRRAAGALGLGGGGLGALASQNCLGAPPLPRSEAGPGGQLVSAFGPRCLACADGRTSVGLLCLLPHSRLGVQPTAPLCCLQPPTHCPAAPLLPCGTPGALPWCSPPAVLSSSLACCRPWAPPLSALLGLFLKSLRVCAVGSSSRAAPEPSPGLLPGASRLVAEAAALRPSPQHRLTGPVFLVRAVRVCVSPC